MPKLGNFENKEQQQAAFANLKNIREIFINKIQQLDSEKDQDQPDFRQLPIEKECKDLVEILSDTNEFTYRSYILQVYKIYQTIFDFNRFCKDNTNLLDFNKTIEKYLNETLPLKDLNLINILAGNDKNLHSNSRDAIERSIPSAITMRLTSAATAKVTAPAVDDKHDGAHELKIVPAVAASSNSPKPIKSNREQLESFLKIFRDNALKTNISDNWNSSWTMVKHKTYDHQNNPVHDDSHTKKLFVNNYNDQSQNSVHHDTYKLPTSWHSLYGVINNALINNTAISDDLYKHILIKMYETLETRTAKSVLRSEQTARTNQSLFDTVTAELNRVLAVDPYKHQQNTPTARTDNYRTIRLKNAIKRYKRSAEYQPSRIQSEFYVSVDSETKPSSKQSNNTPVAKASDNGLEVKAATPEEDEKQYQLQQKNNYEQKLQAILNRYEIGDFHITSGGSERRYGEKGQFWPKREPGNRLPASGYDLCVRINAVLNAHLHDNKPITESVYNDILIEIFETLSQKLQKTHGLFGFFGYAGLGARNEFTVLFNKGMLAHIAPDLKRALKIPETSQESAQGQRAFGLSSKELGEIAEKIKGYKAREATSNQVNQRNGI